MTAVETNRADEAFRVLRSTVKFASGEGPVRSVLVVDVDRFAPSGVAERLASSFGDAGDRCVLVDARSRESSADAGAGLSDLLAGHLAVAEVVGPAESGAFTVVGPGRGLTPDALANDRLSEIMVALVATGALVIVACNPAPSHGDAIAIAPRVDATILVVSAGKTRRARAVEARDSLERVGARLLGVAMVEEHKRWFW